MNNTYKIKFKNQLKKHSFYKETKGGFFNTLPELVILFIFFIIILNSAIFFSNYKYFTVKQNSMRPLLNNYGTEDISDGVFVNVHSTFEVGDVIVIESATTTIIKRVIGMPGDKVTIIKDYNPVSSHYEYSILLIASGTTIPYKLEENYLSIAASTIGMEKAFNQFHELLNNSHNIYTQPGKSLRFLEIEQGKIFYLGDNRGVSEDSLRYGATDIEEVVGKVEIIVKKEQNILFYILQYLLGFKKV